MSALLHQLPTLLQHPSALLKDNCSVTVVNKSVDKVPKPEWRQWPPHKAHLTIFVGDELLSVNVTMTKEQTVEWNQSERRHTVSVLMMQTKCLHVRLQKSVLLFDVGCLNSFDPTDQIKCLTLMWRRKNEYKYWWLLLLLYHYQPSKHL